MSKTRVTLADLRRMMAEGRPFAMLTAYDHPTAAAAQAAGVPTLLVGDSLGSVVLGHENTRSAPFDLMLHLAEAVRRGAPNVFLIGDLPFETMQGASTRVVDAAKRYRDMAGCDAVKLETADGDEAAVERIVAAGCVAIAHLGLRPQTVLTPDGYRVHARDAEGIAALVASCKRMVAAGASLLLLEAVPAEAATAVVEATPGTIVIGCGAGPACHGHVVVTHDMLGFTSARPPRFVPVLAHIGEVMGAAMRRYVADIESRRYPASEHIYPMRSDKATAAK